MRGSDRRFMVILELRQALLHARDPRLEFMFFDKPFGVAVDEATDAAPQGCDLLVQAGEFFWRGGAVGGLGKAAPVFIGNAFRILQEGFDPIPNDLFELIGANRWVGTWSFAFKPLAIRAGAAIIAQDVRLVVIAPARSGLSVIGIAATSTDRQPL